MEEWMRGKFFLKDKSGSSVLKNFKKNFEWVKMKRFIFVKKEIGIRDYIFFMKI